MAKALLILFGGRPMPNMLTVIHEKPELIVAIVSQDEIKKLPQLENTISELYKDVDQKPQLDTSYVIDAFSMKDVREKSLLAVKEHPGFEWIMNITSATTIMSIGAFEAAKMLAAQHHSIRCWYLDTGHTRVVSLVGEGRDENIFHVEVDQYAAVYNCRVVSGSLEDRRQYCQDHWLPFSRYLVSQPHRIGLLKEVVDRINTPSKKQRSVRFSIPSITEETYMLLEKACTFGLLDDLQKTSNAASLKLSYIQADFLKGAWLEVYVWDEANKLSMFSDCQWNQKVIDARKLDDKESRNELDVSMIYNAQLVVAECKTGDDSFKSDTLYKLHSVASQLGGQFVGKMLVTSLQVPTNREALKQYERCSERADEIGIEIVTREKLGIIGQIIKEQAKHPKRARI